MTNQTSLQDFGLQMTRQGGPIFYPKIEKPLLELK